MLKQVQFSNMSCIVKIQDEISDNVLDRHTNSGIYRVAPATKFDYGHLFRAQGSKFSFSIICLSIVIFP